ncbi:hypothetical protein CHS0354_034903 [Potamilus streckersoni]|uniref:Uncharacterized protein n=1 Tax=Potamilus streckersoni TaxID=2493646 RepID=A0AAE0SDW5_9BIVA|nr:hypothetical protein CHS0354_034903 [Potamilus streckersoni]
MGREQCRLVVPGLFVEDVFDRIIIIYRKLPSETDITTFSRKPKVHKMGAWPRLSTLYTSTHNLDEAGKNPDPLMGIDNVFDPNEPYGADRYYVQPRSEMSIEEPSYIRGVYKDDELRSRSSDYAIQGGSKQDLACKIIICIFLIIGFIGVVLAAITLAVICKYKQI